MEAVVEAGKRGRHEKKSYYGYFGNGTWEIADREERYRYRMWVWGT